MAGVVVWAYKNNRNMWNAYEPNVCCELEKLFSVGTQHNVHLGLISSNLSSYEVNLVQMTQITRSSGSVREIKRIIYDLASAPGQGVVWEFEGDQPSQWLAYDLETMVVIEEGYAKRNQLNTSVLDLQQSRLYLPYIIDFISMTQMRVETGRIRRIQRRPMNQAFPPALSQTFGASSSAMPSSSSVVPNSVGQTNWQSPQPAFKVQASKSKNRHQPYNLNKSGTAVNGVVHGAQQMLQQLQQQISQVTQQAFPHLQQQPSQVPQQPSQVPQQTYQQMQQQPSQVPQQTFQQPPQNPGPVTRRQLQQSVASISSAATLQQHPQGQYTAMQQMYNNAQQPFYHQALQNLHITGSYQPMFGQVPGMPPGFQYPSVSLPQSFPATSVNAVPPPLAHQQTSRSLATSSTTSSMSNSQASESLPKDTKISIGKSKKTTAKTEVKVLDNYLRSINTDLDKNDCSICCDKLSEPSSYGEGQADAHEAVELNKCGHQFHKLCLLEMYNSIHKDSSLQCPSCKTIYGEKTGNCPPGYMQWRIANDLILPGYENHGTIILSYHISPGVQGQDHPRPGHRFTARGFPRYGYLPDCNKGRKVLKLLMEAFRRRLMFTVATSHTTGEDNTVTWNEIHHKTEPFGNLSGHGYPDPQYLDNVLMELAAHGVTEDCIR